ncbi:MAG TPA: exosortase/archaeosortase family protein [Armatimonadaceae bacterium]|nr:exosortase/archaeosortase family protein [Armatimonadaceae bacterium]
MLDARLLLAAGGAAALLLAIGWPLLRWWHWEFTKPDSPYGHGYFVPVLVGVMLWHRRSALREAGLRPTPGALLLLLPAIALLILATKTDMQALMSFSFLLSVVSSVWFVAGSRFVRAAAFPLAFLWLMAPLPGPVLNDATMGLQKISVQAAAFLLRAVGFAAVQQGNLISMDAYTLNVDVPCSGFGLLLRLLTFSAAFAYLTDTTLLRRILLFAISLPLSILINGVRIALIGIVGECLGATAAATFHDWSGILSLILCMGILFGSAKALGCRTFAGQPVF